MKLFKRKQPKYKIGDKVKFVYCDDNLFNVGIIWDVKTSFWNEPEYKILISLFTSDYKFGNNEKVTESNIVEKVED